jgi:predicted SprT family Zn-dependent metalloprotease
MDLDKAAHMAHTLMADYDLDFSGWTFAFDNAKRRCGQTRFSTQRITLSRYYVNLNGESEVRDTILHEIAHAIAGPGHGHGARWRTIARNVGATPKRCAENAVMPEGKWRGSCSCGAASEATRHRITKGTYFCRICGSDVTWLPNPS